MAWITREQIEMGANDVLFRLDFTDWFYLSLCFERQRSALMILRMGFEMAEDFAEDDEVGYVLMELASDQLAAQEIVTKTELDVKLDEDFRCYRIAWTERGRALKGTDRLKFWDVEL